MVDSRLVTNFQSSAADANADELLRHAFPDRHRSPSRRLRCGKPPLVTTLGGMFALELVHHELRPSFIESDSCVDFFDERPLVL